MRTMWDAITGHVGLIPANAQLAAGYVNGPISQWTPQEWARFSAGTRLVRISVSPWVNDGHVLDVESGDALPAHAPGWAQTRRGSGLAAPCVYCNLSTLPAVRGAFYNTKVPEPLYWLARPGAAELEALAGATVIATQYQYSGGYDLSVVADFWPGVDPDPAAGQPTPPADPAPAWQEELMGRLPTLTQGDRDNGPVRWVHRLQGLLTAIGISPGAIDGAFGPATLGAVKTCQRQYGLVVDGVVGPHTWSALITGQDL